MKSMAIAKGSNTPFKILQFRSREDITDSATKHYEKSKHDMIMTQIDEFMKKGEANLDQEELELLSELSKEAELYEDTHEPLKSTDGSDSRL